MESTMLTPVAVTEDEIKDEYMRMVRDKARQAARIEMLEARVARLQYHRNQQLKYRLGLQTGRISTRKRVAWECRIEGFLTALYIVGIVRFALWLIG